MLQEYLRAIGLPNITIRPSGEISRAFLQKNIENLWSAIKYVKQLSYGRNSDGDFQGVLKEQKGTCSTKHALIASLAEEQQLPLKLVMGIFLLNAKNTPEATSLLKMYHIEAIPEAHCFLKYNGGSLDITFPQSTKVTFDELLEQEIQIAPEQIGAFKVEKHRAFLRNFSIDAEKLWKAREEWILYLSKQSCLSFNEN